MCYLIQWLIFSSFCSSRGSPTCKIVIIKVVVEKIRITYSSLKVYLKSRTCCKRSSAICFLKALPKLFKIVHSAVCINWKYIYLKLVLSCKYNVAITTHFLTSVYRCKCDIRQHHKHPKVVTKTTRKKLHSCVCWEKTRFSQ